MPDASNAPSAIINGLPTLPPGKAERIISLSPAIAFLPFGFAIISPKKGHRAEET
jgi:hypothetical protein